jgi:hypothetical protein
VIYYKNFNPSKINLYINIRFVRALEKIVPCSIKQCDSGDNGAVERCIVPAKVVIFGSHMWLKLYLQSLICFSLEY